MSAHETTRLITHCLDGDEVAIETLIRTCEPQVYRLALSILDDAAEADEATQDTFVAALRALGSFQGKAAFTTWLYAITVNVCRGRLRKRQVRQRLQQTLQTLFQAGTAAEPIESVVTRHENDDLIRRAVNALDEKQRLAVILRYEQDLPIAEIAQVLGVSERTVHTRLRIAHDQLRVALNGLLEHQ